MDSEALKRRLGERFRVSSLPSVVVRVRERMADPTASLAEIGGLVALDPPLVGKVLRTANGAFYGLKTKVVEVEHAVSVLGLRTLGELVAELPLIGPLPPGTTAARASGGAKLDVADFWGHAVLTARVARSLPEALRQTVARDELYLAGLMHDVGHIVFLDHLGEDFLDLVRRSRRDETPLNQLERETFGFAHTEVGALICLRWNLPDGVVRAARSHHDLGGWAVRDRVVGLVALSNLVAEAATRGGLRRLKRRLTDPLRDSLDLTSDVLERVFADARRLADEVEV